MVRILLGNVKGQKGDKGDKGDKGNQGIKGKDGIDVYSVPRNTQLFNKHDVLLDHTVDMENGEVIENTGFYMSNYIPVLPDGKLMILPTIGQSAFYDLDYNFISGFNSLTGNPVDIPSNARYLLTSGFMSSLDTKMVYIGTEELDYQNYIDNSKDTAVFTTNRVEFTSDGFPVISTPYDETSNIEYTFGQLGINEIYHLKNIKTDYFNHLVTSDYISPYRVSAVNDPIADNPIFVTGGNHGSDGGGGGFATGDPVSIDVYVENMRVTDGVHHTNDPIVVKVTNEVCGYNTVNRTTGEKRNILKENIVYTFHPNNVAVDIEIKALEDVEFYGHRGISIQKVTHNQNAYVSGDDNGRQIGDQSFEFYSSNEGSNSERLVLESTNGSIIALYIDPNKGIGDFRHNNNDPRWFTSTGKAYSNLIDQGTYLLVESGDSLDVSGGYYFGRSIVGEGGGLSRGYTIKESNETLYCIDDFYLRNNNLVVKPKDLSKKVEVISNTGYTLAEYSNPSGVKFSSRRTATVKFKMI